MTAERVALSSGLGQQRRPDQLRGGPHGLTREQVAANQRERISAALNEVLAERGYSDVTVGELTERAGVSRKTFYELYENKEDCFLAVQSAIGERVLERVRRAAEQDATPEQRLDGAIDALVDFCVEEPTATRAFAVEALAAGPHARVLRMELLDELAEALARPIAGLQRDGVRSTVVARATIGAVLELSAHSPDRFASHEPARLAKAIVATHVA